jgi:hypothetical protein
LAGEIKRLGGSIATLVSTINSTYAAKNGQDLFKATNKTATALTRLGGAVESYDRYKDFVTDLYFLFRESAGSRLDGRTPPSFVDVNDLRTDLQHDLDHGKARKVAAKRKKTGATFAKYAASRSPTTLAPERFSVFQAKILQAIEADLRALSASLT